MKNYSMAIHLPKSITCLSLLGIAFLSLLSSWSQEVDIDPLDNDVQALTNGSLDFRSDVYEFARFEVEDDQLTDLEKALTIPKVRHFKYSISPSSNTMTTKAFISPTRNEGDFS